MIVLIQYINLLQEATYLCHANVPSDELLAYYNFQFLVILNIYFQVCHTLSLQKSIEISANRMSNFT